MKVKSTFSKALIFTVAMILSLVTIVSVMPAAAAADAAPASTAVHEDKLKASSATLSGEITVKYFYTGLESFTAETDYVKIIVPDINDVDQEKIIYIKDLEKDEKGRWIVPVSVPYAQQTTEFTMQFYKGGVGGKIRTRSVRQYADTVFTSAETNEAYAAAVAPITSMLNIGAMAQKAFDYKTDDLANKGLYDSEESNPINNMLPEHFYDVVTEPDKGVGKEENAEAYFRLVGGTATLDSAIKLKIVVDCPDNVTEATLTTENKTHTVTINNDNGTRYVTISNIPATSFNFRYILTVGETSVSYSVLDYAISALNSPNFSAAEKDTARALYLFYAQTTAYVKNNDDDDSNDYIHGPKDENGNAIIDNETGKVVCPHERTYTSGNKLICPDCDEYWITSSEPGEGSGSGEVAVIPTKLNVAVRSVEGNLLTLVFSISGDTTPLSGIVFTPQCSADGVTLTVVDYESELFDVTTDNNILVLNNKNNAALNDQELLTITYKVDGASAGRLYKLSVALRAATGESNEDIDVGELLSSIVTFEIK